MKFKISRLLKAILLSTMIATTSIATTCITQTVYAEGETAIPEGGVTAESNNFKGTLSEDGTLRISKIGGSSGIGLHGFLSGSGLSQYGNSIKKLIIEEGVIVLNYENPYNYIRYISMIAPNIEQIVLPNSCTTIANYTFLNLTKLQSIKFGNNTTYIGLNAFQNCSSLKNIKLQPTMTVDKQAFLNNNLKTIDLPDGISFGPTYGDPFANCLALENIIVEGDYSSASCIFSLSSGVYLKKIVYLKSTWDTKLISEPDKHINANTTIYCTEENYESVYEALSSTKAKFIKISGLGDMASGTDISDNNVTLEDVLYDIEEVTDGDELEVPIEGQTNMATVRITVPTEVGFVIAPNTKSKFITKPFKIVNQTGAPITFTLNELKPTSASNALKTVKRTYKNRSAEDWLRLGPEETEEGIALYCTFDVTGGDNFTSTTDRLYVEPDTSAGDITELKLSFDTDAEITGKLGGLYGLAWDDEYTGSYALKGTVKLGYTDEDTTADPDPNNTDPDPNTP